jgi:hypothetical protein
MGELKWKEEPCRFEFDYKGLRCLIIRNDFTYHLCGSVSVNETHIFFEKEVSEIIKTHDLEVHCGLSNCSYGLNEQWKNLNSYKEMYDKEGKELWWLTFDCDHENDIIPISYELCKLNSYEMNEKRTYKDLDYVRNELIKLCDQILLYSHIINK